MDVPAPESEVDPGLIAAYRAACFRVDHAPPFNLTVDVYSDALDQLLRGQKQVCAAFITACNPLGTVLGQAENRQRQYALLDDLQRTGRSWLSGVGRDPHGRWPEEDSLLVLGLDLGAACELGRRHQQNAILWAGADAVPRLVLLR